MSNNYIPYTYLIGWKDLNKFYYGVRYAKNCHPSDLWIKYFTSSYMVEEYRLEFGEPDIIQIRHLFKTKQQALEWEEKVLNKLNVINNDKWLNLSIAGSKFYSNTEGSKMTKKQRELISKKKIEYYANRNEFEKYEHSLRAKEIGNRPEVKEKIKQKALERYNNTDYIEKMKKIQNSEEYKEKARINKQKQLENPEYIEKMKKIQSSIEYKQKQKEIADKVWANEERRKKQSERMKKLCADPEYRKKMSERAKAAYERTKNNPNATFFKKKEINE